MTSEHEQNPRPDNTHLSQTRRSALKKMLVGTGVAAGAVVVPSKWIQPVVDRIFVPAHAQTSPEPPPPTTTPILTTPSPTTTPTPCTPNILTYPDTQIGCAASSALTEDTFGIDDSDPCNAIFNRTLSANTNITIQLQRRLIWENGWGDFIVLETEIRYRNAGMPAAITCEVIWSGYFQDYCILARHGSAVTIDETVYGLHGTQYAVSGTIWYDDGDDTIKLTGLTFTPQ